MFPTQFSKLAALDAVCVKILDRCYRGGISAAPDHRRPAENAIFFHVPHGNGGSIIGLVSHLDLSIDDQVQIICRLPLLDHRNPGRSGKPFEEWFEEIDIFLVHIGKCRYLVWHLRMLADCTGPFQWQISSFA